MKRHRFAATALLCCALTVSGCGIIRTVGAIGSLFGGHKKASTVVTVVKILGSVLGQFYDTTTKTALVGNWTYDEPAIQFESENLLKKAGGAVASQGVADKLSPYFEMIGFKPGSISINLREDNTCTYLKTPAGIFTEVTLPVDEISTSHSTDSLLTAKIVFQRHRDAA